MAIRFTSEGRADQNCNPGLLLIALFSTNVVYAEGIEMRDKQ